MLVHQRVEGQRRDEGADTQHDEDVQDIGTQYVADGNARVFLGGGHDAGDEFRQRRRRGDHSQADGAFAHAPVAGEDLGVVGDEFAAEVQAPDADDQ